MVRLARAGSLYTHPHPQLPLSRALPIIVLPLLAVDSSPLYLLFALPPV